MTESYIVDLQSFFRDHSQHGHLYDIYQRYPLKAIVNDLLSPCEHYMEYIWLCVEHKFTEDMDYVELEGMELFFDILSEDLDRFMAGTLALDFSHTEFHVKAWIGQTVIVLERL